MTDFADRTGLTSPRQPTRYLWTDAFALTNCLAIWRATEDDHYLELAFRLIEEVHETLGKHRSDDEREGWISGLSDVEARRHPTQAGLRIGKKLPERGPAEEPNSILEWERDGQYFHYLSKWMHALDQTARWAQRPHYNQWAQELAITAYRRFRHVLPGSGISLLYWKMSIDLSRPLVTSMGQHDPLDGYLVCAQLRASAAALGVAEHPDLQATQSGFAAMTRSDAWTTSDTLGLGGLLTDACRAHQLAQANASLLPDLVPELLLAALVGLATCERRGDFTRPALERLAFRELGLAIGLGAVEIMESIEATARTPSPQIARLLLTLRPYLRLQAEIRDFWLLREHQDNSTWLEHRDINEVMLATVLIPNGQLTLPGMK